ncbi:MAG: hypothetical protein AB7P21_09765 [Lautropia sp.]
MKRFTSPNGRAGTIAVAVASIALAGCAGMADPTGLFSGGGAAPANPSTAAGLAERPPASGPAAPTVVLEESYTLDGAIMPVTRGQSRVETRADRRRTDAVLSFDNWMIRQFAGDGRSSDIVRIDRGLVWTLEPAKRSYVECPITGCVSAAGKPGASDKPAQRRPDEPAAPPEPTCPVRVKTNDLKVEQTGERRTVNGFAAERFKLTWTVEVIDGSGAVGGNWIRMDLWTTPETGAVREAKAVTDAFERRYVAAVTRGATPVGQFLPPKVNGAMAALMKNFDANDQRTMARWAAEMRKIRGFPVMTEMNWTAQGEVCVGSGAGTPSPQAAAGIGGMLGGLFGGRRPDGAPAPLITFSHEVKTLAVRPVADNVFDLPPDYQRRDLR